MSPALKSLLLDMRQHPAFRELLDAVETPRLTQYRPSQSITIEQMGARTIYESGKRDQHEKWLTLLTGEPPSQKEQS